MKSNEFTRKLFIVATPIGHLDDFSHRAIKILSEANLVLCENMQHSLKLLNHYGIVPRRLAKLTDHDREQVRQLYLDTCFAGSIALISDAGTPLISDPGCQLVKQAWASGFAVLAVPGPSAVIAALSICPFAPVPFQFYGFLPRKRGERMRLLQSLADCTTTMVFYESPHRLHAMCHDLSMVFGACRQVFVVKELTKRFEASWYGELAGVYQQLAQTTLQGEFVVIVAGYEDCASMLEESITVSVKALVAAMVKSGMTVQTVQNVLGAVANVKKNEIYQYFLACKAQEH